MNRQATIDNAPLRAWHRVAMVTICACLALAGCSDNKSVDPGSRTAGASGASSQANGATHGKTGNDSASGNGADNTASNNGSGDSAGGGPQSRQGRVYRQQITAGKTGDTVVFQVMEPTKVTAGKTYPLVLHSHGYGGSRSKTPDAFQQRLRDAGYYVISIDERGFGDSSGTIRVMSPDFEGQDLIAVLDWAEGLEHLRRRANGKMDVGSYGGSYGGMYQYLLMGADPQQRLRVIAPDISPFDLTYSLDPHNVIKTGWVLALIGAGEGGAQAGQLTSLSSSGDPSNQIDELLTRFQNANGTRQDPVIYESLVRGGLTNRFPEPAYNLFRYHSLRYFCENKPAASQAGFTIGQPDPRDVAPGGLPKVDALLTQGFRDTLFNFNDGYRSYRCLKSHGGDVRLLTHQSGHILPASLGTVGLEDPLDPFYAALTVPSFQDAGGSRTCGSLDLQDITFAWFQQKLRGKKNALAAELTTGHNVCLSLAEGDAISVKKVKTGGKAYNIDDDTPALSGPLGVLGATLGSEPRGRLLQTQKLFTVGGNGAIIAGIPTMDITIEPLVETPGPVGGATHAAGDDSSGCTAEAVPTNCDPVYFFAIGKRAPGDRRWDVIDDQITPVRGFGEHKLDMNGIAERLPAGYEVGLLIYGFHPQYPVSFSRDLFVPASELNGEVKLPKLAPKDIVRQGV